MTKTTFKNVQFGEIFTYGGQQYRKYRDDKARDPYSMGVGERFSQDAEVEIARVITVTDPNAATEKQLAYLNRLGVVIPDGKSLTKQLASQVIDAVLSGDGVGTFGLFFRDGSN